MYPERPVRDERIRRLARRAVAFSAAPLALVALCLAACSKTDGRGEEAFAADRSVTLWSSLAQVRQPVATLHYGERVEVLEKRNDQMRVRTATAFIGWTEARALMDSALWQRARALADRAAALPVQARASADKLTNAHIDPGRKSPRVFQFRGGTPLEVVEHAVAEFTPGAGEDVSSTKDRDAASAQPEARREDWILVRAGSDNGVSVAGWVLRRFVKLELPAELLEYSSQYRFVAWFELNRVPAGAAQSAAAQGNAPGPPDSGPGEPAGDSHQKPQFLVAGIQGPDGQPCDFTLLRVYTWSAPRQRYETAYVESHLCARLPIRVQPAAALGGNAAFAFANTGKLGEEQRQYSMHITSVRRVDRRPPPRGARPSRGSGR